MLDAGFQDVPSMCGDINAPPECWLEEDPSPPPPEPTCHGPWQDSEVGWACPGEYPGSWLIDTGDGHLSDVVA